MKKIILSIAFCFISSLIFAESKISFLDIKGKEIAIIIDNNDDYFQEYYLVQYTNQDFSELVNLNLTGTVEIANESLIIRSDKGTYAFALNGNKPDADFVYDGYGLSHRKGEYKIIDNPEPEYIFNVIVFKANAGGFVGGVDSGGSIKCLSGGIGSTACSVKASSVSVGTAECSVTCGAGYYSCCDDTKGECRCIAIPK